MNILEKFLKHIGVESYSELTDQEKATFDSWSKILEKEVSLETLQDFCDTEVTRLSNDLLEAIRKDDRTNIIRLGAKIENYKAMSSLITSPKDNKEKFKKTLEALIT